MNYPKITIITPTFNQAQYIEQTIDSVLSQNYPNLEYMILDGGSTDDTVKIIQRYEKQLTYWESAKDRGQSHAINKGLKRATGEIINWLNSDDYYESNALKAVAQGFENPQILVVGGRGRLFRGDETIKYYDGTTIYRKNLAKTIGWARIDQPETFFRREAVMKMGFLDEQFHYLMDREWWLRYLFLFGLDNVLKIPDVLVNFRLHNTSKTVSQGNLFNQERNNIFYSIALKYQIQDYIDFFEKNLPTFTKYELALLEVKDMKLLKEAMNYFILLQANEFYAQNQQKNTSQYLKFVNSNFLQDEDKKLLSTLKFRNHFLIKSLIQISKKAKTQLNRLFRHFSISKK